MATIGILLGITCLIYFSYKGLSVNYLAPLAALLVALLSGLPLLDSFTGSYMTGLTGFAMHMFPILLLGSVLGRIYGDSGAATAVAKGISSALSKHGTPEKTQQLLSIIVILSVGAVLTYGGIDALATLFAIFTLTVGIMKENDIPRRFLPAFVVAGPASGIFCLPGSPQLINVIPTQILGTSPSAALIPGVIAGFMGFIGSIIYLNYAITKAKAKGDGFEYGDSSFVLACKREDDSVEHLPKFIMALIPMIAIFVTFNVIGTSIIIALAVGIFLSLALLGRYIGDGHWKSVVNSLNEGSQGGVVATVSVGALVGFGTVVSASSGFQAVLDNLVSMEGSPLWLLATSVAVIAGIGGSSPGGLGIAVPVLAPIYIDTLGVSPEAFHRVASFAAGTLDTLPSNAGVILLIGMAGLTHKQAYKHIGMCTVVMTSIATVVVVTLLTLFPGLA
jgi:H+/gluconate symporter-like permease